MHSKLLLILLAVGLSSCLSNHDYADPLHVDVADNNTQSSPQNNARNDSKSNNDVKVDISSVVDRYPTVSNTNYKLAGGVLSGPVEQRSDSYQLVGTVLPVLSSRVEPPGEQTNNQ